MKVAIGSDHGGFALKKELIAELKTAGYELEDLGTYTEDSCDYPDIAGTLASKVSDGTYQRGILICGTGIGMSIAANKVKGTRAALCHDVYSAKMTRLHNDSNVLCLGARVIGSGLALAIVKTWLNEEFEGGRHQTRVTKLHQLEG